MSCSLKKGTFKEQRSVFSKFLTRTFREIFDKASLENENSIFVEEIPRTGFLIGIPVSIKGDLPILVECDRRCIAVDVDAAVLAPVARLRNPVLGPAAGRGEAGAARESGLWGRSGGRW